MISEAELIVDRRKLKRRVTFWRILAVLLAIATVAALIDQPLRHSLGKAGEFPVTDLTLLVAKRGTAPVPRHGCGETLVQVVVVTVHRQPNRSPTEMTAPSIESICSKRNTCPSL